jgi:hypothetical protein
MKTLPKTILVGGMAAGLSAAPAMAANPPSGDLTIGSIISGTPAWVWVLLIVLLYFGLRATQARTLGFFGYVIFPVIMVVLSINALSLLRLDAANGATIAVGAVLGIIAGTLLERRFAPTPLGNGRLHLAGEWTNLITVLVVFAVRYATGVIQAVDLPLTASPGFQVAVGIISALVAAMLLARIILRLRVAYGPKAPASESAAAR